MKLPIYAVICFLCGPGAGLRSEVLYTEPPSVEALVSIDGVRVDGSLNLVYNVGTWVLGSRESVPITIVHRLKTDPAGHTLSEMAITGLTAFSAPADRYLIHCMFLGGAETVFASEKLGASLTNVGTWVSARRPANGRLDVKSVNGWSWLYENGKLIAVEGTNLLKITVLESQGAKLVSLRATRLGGLVGELNATYDVTGNMMTLAFGSQRHQFGYSGPRHQLTDWVANVEGKETKIHFEYADDLLVRVTRDGVVQRELQWETVPLGLTADTEWPAPVRVSHLDKREFTYGLDYKGYSMIAKNQADNVTQRRVLNINRGLVDSFESGIFVQRVFFGTRKGQASAGKVTRIEDGQQKFIAKYDYDPLGRILSYEMANGKIDFTYDQDGRCQKTVHEFTK